MQEILGDRRVQDAARRDRQQGTDDTAAVKSVTTKPEQSEEPASASNGVVQPTPASSTSAASDGARGEEPHHGDLGG